MPNINQGDRVIATANLGTGAGNGTKGTVTHVSMLHGLATVRFDTGKEIKGVKLTHLRRA
jgi:hypothetical protein